MLFRLGKVVEIDVETGIPTLKFFQFKLENGEQVLYKIVWALFVCFTLINLSVFKMLLFFPYLFCIYQQFFYQYNKIMFQVNFLLLTIRWKFTLKII